MYFKYFGIDKNTGKIRTSFLHDGLFRFTQPRDLNDPKEGKPRLYIHEYSPKDIQLARNKLRNDSFISFGAEISDEDVIALGLNPFPAMRYGDAFPHLIQQYGFNSMKEYDEAQLLIAYQTFENQLNKEVGVFSLTTDNKNQVMWSSYGNDYNGIVLGFSDEIKYFKGYIAQDVDYDTEKIDFQLSLNQGIIRFNGLKVEEMQNNKFAITQDLLKSFLFHKDKKWGYECEFRILSWLKNADHRNGTVFLEKLPFPLFQSLYIGCNVSKKEQSEILCILKNKTDLSHIKVYIQTFGKLTGDIKFGPIDL